jgi:hypothetical protein
MRDEIVKGILIGLVLVVCFVSAGSFIGSYLSHGPEPREDAAVEAPAEATEGEEAAAEGEEAAAEGEEAAAEGEEAAPADSEEAAAE